MQFTYVLGTLIGAFGQLEQITIIITFIIIIINYDYATPDTSLRSSSFESDTDG